jgi:hypothetical protein
MHPCTLMIRRHVRQGVRRLEMKQLGQRDVHAVISIPSSDAGQSSDSPGPRLPDEFVHL